MKPCSDKTQHTKFAVYDVEAFKWTNVVCVCHVDEFGNRVQFTNMHDYLDWAYSPAFSGTHVWAHWGGQYDSRFILPIAYERLWSCETVQSGNLMIVTSIKNDEGRTIHFCESARIMPDSVEAIGKSIGLPKLDADRAHLEGERMETIIEYCYRDCDIVLLGLKEMRRVFSGHQDWEQLPAGTRVSEGLGFDFAYTLASQCTRWIRRSGVVDFSEMYERTSSGRRELREDFVQADTWCTPAYFGGRTECFWKGFHSDLYYFDITSSYPWSMQFELPLYFEEYKIPMRRRSGAIDIERSLRERCGITEAVITIPRPSNWDALSPKHRAVLHLPILPVRADHKILFRNHSEVRGRWTNLELLALWERLQDYKGFKMELVQQACYKPMAFMKPFVEMMWALRQQAIAKKDAFKKYAYKIALNAPSGKLAEQEDKESLVFGDAYSEALEKYGRKAVHGSKIPGVFTVKHKQRGAFRHVAAAAYITGRSRLRLYEGMEQCLAMGGEVLYCDTDSIITNIKAFPEKPKALGEWHLEHHIERAELWAPKNYKLTLKPGTYDPTEVHHGVLYRAKGIPIEKREDRHDPKAAEMRWMQYVAKHHGLDLPPPEKEGIYGLRQSIARGVREGLPPLMPEPFVLKRRVQSIDTKRMHVPGDVRVSEPLYFEALTTEKAVAANDSRPVRATTATTKSTRKTKRVLR